MLIAKAMMITATKVCKILVVLGISSAPCSVDWKIAPHTVQLGSAANLPSLFKKRVMLRLHELREAGWLAT